MSASFAYPGGKGKSKTRLLAPTPEEYELITSGVQLANEELANVRRQAEISKFLSQELPGYFESAGGAEALDFDRQMSQLDVDQSRADISSAAENALRLGEADVQRQTRLGLEELRDVLAPERGLRPGDSPILGLGSDITREGLFNMGQLTREIRAREAEALATVPFERLTFQADLANRAFQNRLSLASLGSQGFLGLDIGSPLSQSVYSGLSQARIAQPKTKSSGFGGMAGGAGFSGSYNFIGGSATGGS